MAGFWCYKRIIFKKCYQIFFVSLCFTLVKCIAIRHHKKVHKEFSLKTTTLPSAHIKEMTETSPVYILIYKNVNANISNAIVSLYARKVPVVVSNNNKILPRCNNQDTLECFKILNFVGILSEPHNVNIKLWLQIFDRRWNTRSKIIIWITKAVPSSEIENLLKLFWKHECLNVVILMRTKKLKKFDVYSYNPFVFNESMERGFIYQLSYSDDFFPNKIQNLYGYEIRISVFHRPPHTFLSDNTNELGNGTELQLLNNMATRFNFTSALKLSNTFANDYVVELKNGTKEGPVGDLFINKSDMLGNAFYINTAFQNRVEFINPFFLAKYIVIVPKGIGETIVLQLFHQITQILLEPVYILMLLSFCILAYYLHIKKERYCILASWELLLYQRFRKFESNYFDKYFRLMWIIWATIFVSLYQGVVYQYLSLPKTVADIDTLKELYNNGIKLRLTEGIISPLNNSEETYKRGLAQRATVVLKLRDCYEELEEYNNVACGSDNVIGTYYFRTLLLSKKPKAHVVKEVLDQFWVTYIVKDGFPFIENLQFTVLQFIENGLFRKWVDDSESRYLVAPNIVHTVVPLSISYFDITFFLLYIGCIVSIVIFIVEIIRVHFKNKM